MRIIKNYLFILSLLCFYGTSNAQESSVFYAGGISNQVFYDVAQIENGQFLIAGSCDQLDWIPANVPLTEIAEPNIANSQGSSTKYGFIAQLDSLLEFVHVVYLAQGTSEDIRFMKFTHVPGEPTGDLYVSGNTSDSKANGGGYFIGKLNNNFHNGVPNAFEWVHNVWAESRVKETHPWDVGSDGKVVYSRGQYQDYDWAAVHRLDAFGERDVVENWRTHWGVREDGNFEWRNTPASNFDGEGTLVHSGIVFKRWGRCDLRSWTQDEHDQWLTDGNGGAKKGTWPLDAFFDGPCDPDDPTGNMPGYTGYSLAGTPVYGPTCITIDRRNNDLYIGFTAKSVLPGGNPDFEPSVVAMDHTGYLKWWSRLYHEVTPLGDTVNSSPDQYIDALAIDYSQSPEDAFLTVNARCHGNNVENFWEGNAIHANPNAHGFQNQFTGSSGNIHISWLGKLKLGTGELHHSTYVAEYAEGASGLGSPHPNPLLAGWPNPNAAWPTLNTTRLAVNNMKVTKNGSVCILGTGRRTITTSNAYQKMPIPGNGGLSTWNSFVRVYESDFSQPYYSSLVVGAWDTLTQQGGGNTRLHGLFKTGSGVIAVGEHRADMDGQALGVPIPTLSLPSWGSTTPVGQTGIIAYLKADELINPDDAPIKTTDHPESASNQAVIKVYPNPASNEIYVDLGSSSREAKIKLFSSAGTEIMDSNFNSFTRLNLSPLSDGVYFLKIIEANATSIQKIIIDKSSQK